MFNTLAKARDAYPGQKFTTLAEANGHHAQESQRREAEQVEAVKQKRAAGIAEVKAANPAYETTEEWLARTAKERAAAKAAAPAPAPAQVPTVATLSRADFDKLPPAQRSEYMARGGKIVDPEPKRTGLALAIAANQADHDRNEQARIAARVKCGFVNTGKTMARADFDRLSAAEKVKWCTGGGAVH